MTGVVAPTPTQVALARPPDALRYALRDTLTAAPGFAAVGAEDRRTIANALVRIAHAAKLLEREAEPDPSPAVLHARAMNAGDQYSGTAVDRMAGTTQRMISAISFPRFVSELINGVFRAMVETNQQQLNQYLELVRGVSQSLDGFVSLSGDDSMAQRWLVERFPQSFELEVPDPRDRPDPDEKPEPARLISIGTAPTADALRAALGLTPEDDVPTQSGEGLVPFVRRALARNRQQMLATMVQMGMQRIVIDAGRINASMRFHIDASSAAAEDRGSSTDTRTSIGASASGGFGFWSASASVNSTIGYVSTTDTRTREELNASADLNSSVELHFRTDEIPLNRIASNQTVDRLRLNTLNPERELDIARQAEQTRLDSRRQTEAANAAAKRPAPAPGVPQPQVPALAPLDAKIVAERAKASPGKDPSGPGPGNPKDKGAGTAPAANETTHGSQSERSAADDHK